MFEATIATGYWLITFTVIAYLGCRELFLLKRCSAWTLPANVTNHHGLRVPDGTSIFASPGDIGGRLLSVEAVAVSEPDNIVPIRLMIGAAYGAVWSAAGLWISAVETGFSLWLLITVNSAVMAIANQRGVKDAFITYVSEEGFGLVTIRCDGTIKYLLPHMTRRQCYLFDELESATLVGDVIMCTTRQRRSSNLLTLRRPLPFPPDDWQRWFQRCRHSLEDIGYSTSLSKLAEITKLTDPMGLANIVGSDLGVTFEIHSILGAQRHTDQVAPRLPVGGQPRRPIGRLAFCETGFVVEDWIPLYASLRKLDLYSEGLEFMFWKIESLDRGIETRKVIDEWREEHVVSLPINVIDSISAEPDMLSISTIDGRCFNFFGDQIAGYAVLMRLIKSSIWSQGIEAELVAQIESDLKQLCEAGNAADLTGVIFGDRLPKHRASIWYAASRFRLHPGVGNELELSVRDQVFHDCFRVLQVQSSFELDTMQRFLDSSRTIHCLSQPATSTGVASTPEIVVDSTSLTRPSCTCANRAARKHTTRQNMDRMLSGNFSKDLRGLNGRLPCTGHADRPWGRCGLWAERPLVFAGAHTGSMPLGRHATRKGSAGRSARPLMSQNSGSRIGIQYDLATARTPMRLTAYCTALKCSPAAMCQLKVSVNTYADTLDERPQPLDFQYAVPQWFVRHE